MKKQNAPVFATILLLCLIALGGLPHAAAAASTDSVTPQAIFMVTFVSNEGSFVSPYTNVFGNSLIPLPADPVRDGYSFSGWYRDSALADEWDFDRDRVTENIFLYAGWGGSGRYRVSVAKGYADRSYAYSGERVEITADEPDWDRYFHRWETSTPGVRFANEYRERTTFVMPPRNVSVRAIYRSSYYYDDWYGGCSSGFVGALGFVGFLFLLRRKDRPPK